MARFRRTTSKGRHYLQYVHSYRNKKGQPATKVLGSLGNITNLSDEEVKRITLSFFKALGIEEKFKMKKFTAISEKTTNVVQQEKSALPNLLFLLNHFTGSVKLEFYIKNLK